MAYLYVSEYPGLAATMQGSDIAAVPAPSTVDQQVAIGGSSGASAAFQSTTRYVELSCDTVCSVAFGPAPVATDANLRLAANERKLFSIPIGQSYKVAVISNS